MFDQIRELLSTIMNTGQHGDALKLALKLAIGTLIFYYGYMFIFKRKSRKQSTSPKSRTATAEPIYEKPAEEPSIDGTEAVDKMIVKKLTYHDTLNFEERQLTTSTGYNASDVYDRIDSLIRNSNHIADELKRNESNMMPGNSSSDVEGFEVTMSNYDVEINLIGWTVNLSLGQLQSLSSVDDLKGEIDDGLILGYDAFRTY